MNDITVRFIGTRHNARSLALQVLLDCQPGLRSRRGEGKSEGRSERFIQDVLDRHLGSPAGRALSAADRRLTTHLAYGVLRRRGTLEALLRGFVERRQDQVEPWLWETLLLGIYQLCLLTQVPVHAALNETVELSRQFGQPRAAGFLNGVLRAAVALVTQDRLETPGPDALPLESGNYRRLGKPVFPDPMRQPAAYVAEAFSFPGWLATRWLSSRGLEECLRLGFWFAGPAPLTLRVNLLRGEREPFLKSLEEAGLHPEPGEHPAAVRLREHVPVRELPGYEEGLFTVQDESAMRIASAVDPQPGENILDLCSAPGGKTTHLAELMRDQGRIVACDIDAMRLATVNELAGRLGVRSIKTMRVDPARMTDTPRGPFDRVLADVPCSNTGVLGRRPEVRWRLMPGEISRLSRVQVDLLRVAVERTRAGGTVVYSTCSIEPVENQEVVRKLLAERTDLHLEAEEAAVPGQPADGGYWARLRKS